MRWTGTRKLALTFAGSMTLLVGCAEPRLPPGAIPQHGVEAALATFREVFDETDDPFEARRQAELKHFELYGSNPEFSQRLRALTALLWTAQGGEWAGAECYMRGFQFGTAHHDQCVYEAESNTSCTFMWCWRSTAAAKAASRWLAWNVPVRIGATSRRPLTKPSTAMPKAS